MELVVQRRAAQPGRQHFLENAHHLAANQRHALASQLPEAVDAADMICQPPSLELAPARAALDDAVIVALDVQEEFGRRGDSVVKRNASTVTSVPGTARGRWMSARRSLKKCTSLPSAGFAHPVPTRPTSVKT